MEKNFRLLAFDADDTLWECQAYFEQVERRYCEILAPYGDEDKISADLFKTETANMPLLGYGSKAFTLSLVENAVRVSEGKVPASDILEIVRLGKSLLELDGKPLPGVRETLEEVRKMDLYRMVVFTKGEILDQEHKYERSGLGRYFDDLIVVSDKTQERYERLCRDNDCDISQLLMIGNSFRSDISPVLQMGGWGAYIPHMMWKHEHAEEYDHCRLLRMTRFSQLTELLR